MFAGVGQRIFFFSVFQGGGFASCFRLFFRLLWLLRGLMWLLSRGSGRLQRSWWDALPIFVGGDVSPEKATCGCMRGVPSIVNRDQDPQKTSKNKKNTAAGCHWLESDRVSSVDGRFASDIHVGWNLILCPWLGASRGKRSWLSAWPLHHSSSAGGNARRLAQAVFLRKARVGLQIFTPPPKKKKEEDALPTLVSQKVPESVRLGRPVQLDVAGTFQPRRDASCVDRMSDWPDFLTS